MTQQPQEAPATKFKQKNWAQINGACKMAKLSGGEEIVLGRSGSKKVLVWKNLFRDWP